MEKRDWFWIGVLGLSGILVIIGSYYFLAHGGETMIGIAMLLIYAIVLYGALNSFFLNIRVRKTKKEIEREVNGGRQKDIESP